MKKSSILFVGGFIFLAVCTVIFSYAEVYVLIADEDLPIRKIANRADSAENNLLILKKGERLKVSGCINYKSDIAIEVIVSESRIGYVNDGRFHLEHLRWPFKILFSDAKNLVWSCGSFFNSRKIEI